MAQPIKPIGVGYQTNNAAPKDAKTTLAIEIELGEIFFAAKNEAVFCAQLLDRALMGRRFSAAPFIALLYSPLHAQRAASPAGGSGQSPL